MFGFLRGEKTYFINYTIQQDVNHYTLNHRTVKIKCKKSTDYLSDVVKLLAEEHNCSVKQIVVNAFNEC